MKRRETGIMIIVGGTVLFMGWFVVCMFLATIGRINLGLEQYDWIHGLVSSIYFLSLLLGIILSS